MSRNAGSVQSPSGTSRRVESLAAATRPSVRDRYRAIHASPPQEFGRGHSRSGRQVQRLGDGDAVHRADAQTFDQSAGPVDRHASRKGDRPELGLESRDHRRRLGRRDSLRIQTYAAPIRPSPRARHPCPSGSRSRTPTGSKPRRPPRGMPTRGSHPSSRAVATGSARATRMSAETSTASRRAPTTERRASDSGAPVATATLQIAAVPLHDSPAARRTAPTSAPRAAASAAALSVGSPPSARYLHAYAGAVPPDSRTARRRTVSIGSAVRGSRRARRCGVPRAVSTHVHFSGSIRRRPSCTTGRPHPVTRRRPAIRSTYTTASMAPALCRAQVSASIPASAARASIRAETSTRLLAWSVPAPPSCPCSTPSAGHGSPRRDTPPAPAGRDACAGPP